MTIKTLLNELDKISDKSLVVSMKYNRIYPITTATAYDYSSDINKLIAIGVCFKNTEGFTFKVSDMISFLNNLIDSDSGIGPLAKVFIDAKGYMGLPCEVIRIYEDEIQVDRRWIKTIILTER